MNTFLYLCTCIERKQCRLRHNSDWIWYTPSVVPKVSLISPKKVHWDNCQVQGHSFLAGTLEWNCSCCQRLPVVNKSCILKFLYHNTSIIISYRSKVNHVSLLMLIVPLSHNYITFISFTSTSLLLLLLLIFDFK